MFNPKLIFEPEVKMVSDCAAVAAPSCDFYWAAASECKCRHGCITPSWTSTSSN